MLSDYPPPPFFLQTPPPTQRNASLTRNLNILLLRCAAVLAATDPETAATSTIQATAGAGCGLSLADAVLSRAAAARRADLAAKAHLFRGHCLRRLARWPDAHAAYVRAARVRPFAADDGPRGLRALTAECAARAGRRRAGGGNGGSGAGPRFVHEARQALVSGVAEPPRPLRSVRGKRVGRREARGAATRDPII